MAVAPDTNRGSAVYFSFVLRYIYDFLVLRLYCNYVWRCPAHNLGALYSTQLEAQLQQKRPLSESDKRRTHPLRVMDVGVGTGYHMSHAPLTAHSEVVLADLNTNCLEAASERTQAVHPSVKITTLQADFLESREDAELVLSRRRLGGGGAGFDLISCLLLLHCLPGPPQRKVDALARLGHLLEKDGVLLGATILGSSANHTLLGRFIMFWHNLLGVFGNNDDEALIFAKGLEGRFGKVECQVIGTVFLFAAQYPKKN